MDVTAWARFVARDALEPLGRRWAHVQAVAQSAESIAFPLGLAPNELIAAAWLHDIGYAPNLATTGFHPLDGARFVRDQGHTKLANLVAHHTGARNEAKLRGLAEFEDEFPYEDSLMQRALTYCDLTTGPGGDHVDVRGRVDEIVRRYGENHVVSQAILIGRPEFLTIEAEIEAVLALSGEPASDH